MDRRITEHGWATAPATRRRQPLRRPTIEPVLPVIRQILDDDTRAPKKQRHTARRIWQRLKDEHGFAGGYTSVKDAVRDMKVGRKEVFLPLTHPPGEAQVDYGFAEAVVINGGDTSLSNSSAAIVIDLPRGRRITIFPSASPALAAAALKALR